MKTSTQRRDVIMEQRADIRQIVPFIRDMVKGGQDGGIHVNMIGPIHITHVDGSRETDNGVIQVNDEEIGILSAGTPEHGQGPLLLRGLSTEPMEINEDTLKKFAPIYNKLPENKLDATVRLVVETAYRRDSSPRNIAKALNCSLYKARSIMGKFNLSS